MSQYPPLTIRHLKDRYGKLFIAYGPGGWRHQDGTVQMLRFDAHAEKGEVFAGTDTAFRAMIEAEGYTPETDLNKFITISATDLLKLIDAITAPDYAYARNDGKGYVSLYRRDVTSPSGVFASGWGHEEIVEPLLRKLRDNSPLSPNEGLNKSGAVAYN